jgi:ABC-type multidrug transport system permease subunit
MCCDVIQVFFPIIFVCIAYWMVGLNSAADRFFTFLLIIVLTSNCAYSLGYIIATAAPTVQVALAIGPVILLPFMIFGECCLSAASLLRSTAVSGANRPLVVAVAVVVVVCAGGFLINLDSIPKYFYWLSYLSFFRYGFEALVATEFKGVNLSCADAVGVCKYPDGQAILNQVLHCTSARLVCLVVSALLASVLCSPTFNGG